jgi:hypothetical protein
MPDDALKMLLCTHQVDCLRTSGETTAAAARTAAAEAETARAALQAQLETLQVRNRRMYLNTHVRNYILCV